MKPPLLINSVLPGKVFHIYSADWRWITDFSAANASQALAGARAEFGEQCKVAVITTAVIKDHYARRTTSSNSNPGIPRPTGAASNRARINTLRRAPAPFAKRPKLRGLATLGATITRPG
jgi:hypothetical protein